MRSFPIALCAAFLMLGVFSSQSPADELLRIKLSIDEYGNCTVGVEPTEDSLDKATEFEGEVVQSAKLSQSSILRNNEGQVRLQHDFSNPDKFEDLFMDLPGSPNTNARFDKRFQCLLLASAEGDDAIVNYRYRLQPPLTLVCDRYPLSKSSTIRLMLTNAKGDALAIVLTTGKKGVQVPSGKARISSAWRELGGQPVNLLSATDFSLKDGTEKSFRLPLPNQKIEDAFLLTIRTNSSPQPANHEIAGLLVQGSVTPLFGIAFDARRGVVFAKQIVKGSLAENAGIKVGDVFLSINGEQPNDVEQAVALLGKAVIGETATLEIERAGNQATVELKSE